MGGIDERQHHCHTHVDKMHGTGDGQFCKNGEADGNKFESVEPQDFSHLKFACDKIEKLDYSYLVSQAK